MKEIIILVFIAGLVFLFFAISLILGLATKKKVLIIISIALFFTSIGLGVYSGHRFVTKSYNRISKLLKPRTGDEIFEALFGKPKIDCIKVLNYQDQVIPKIDYAIWLHFKTCPDELVRIISLHKYEMNKVSTKSFKWKGPLANDNWFKPELMGDSIMVFNCRKDDYGNEQTIYCKLDMTEVFCIDILD